MAKDRLGSEVKVEDRQVLIDINIVDKDDILIFLKETNEGQAVSRLSVFVSEEIHVVSYNENMEKV